MIYLRTGANGTCKTLFTLKDVREKQIKEGRPVCWNGRFKLKPELEKEWGWKRIDFKDWQAQQDGTIFLIDECHNDLPKRPNGSAVPDHVGKLAEHRARGFDFFLITQHPSNIDTFVTKLVGAPGWHQHLKRIAGGSKLTSVLQWDAVNTTCEKNGSARQAQVTTRSQPKEVYGWYDSAELHTEKVRIPKTWMVIGAAVILFPLLAIGGFKMLWKSTTAPANHAPLQGASDAGAMVVVDRPARGVQGDRPVPLTPAEYVAVSLPRVEGLPHTAPRYDEVTRPQTAPYPAACIEMKSKGCKCYTQQGTLIAGVSLDMCRQIISTGFFIDFDPGQRHDDVREAVVKQDIQLDSPVRGKPVGSRASITAGDIAKLSKSTTGSNPWARNSQAPIEGTHSQSSSRVDALAPSRF